jgi:signal transduction histidine kinase
MLNIIGKDIEYSNKIINDLLEYSKEVRLEQTETTPKNMIKEAITQLRIPKNITLKDSTRKEPKIDVDIDRLKRTFINIIKNAFDAMPKGGMLTISSERKEHTVSFSFNDTGTGMNQETLQKLWTPLFTTKAKGMGFGLAICKRVIEAHGGRISAESKMGKGTTIFIVLPYGLEVKKSKDVWVGPPVAAQLEEAQ